MKKQMSEVSELAVVPNPVANQRGSALPYLFAWILGVPTSLLFLIFLVRAVF